MSQVKKKRIAASDRRRLILESARKAFASRGFEQTSVQEIAKDAGVSSALVFQHYFSKDALYKAVLHDLIQEQDAGFAAFGNVHPSAEGLIDMLFEYFARCIHPSDAYVAEGSRFELASLAGSGEHARLLSARAAGKSMAPFTAALDAARASGELTGPALDPPNMISFLHSIGTMLTASGAAGEEVLVLSKDRNQILRDVILFCGQGLGLSRELITEKLAFLGAPDVVA